MRIRQRSSVSFARANSVSRNFSAAPRPSRAARRRPSVSMAAPSAVVRSAFSSGISFRTSATYAHAFSVFPSSAAPRASQPTAPRYSASTPCSRLYSATAASPVARSPAEIL